MAEILDHAAIGEKIRKFRMQAGFTQEHLAEELEITFQQIQKYERGITKVNLIKLQQLANVLSVPIAAFFECDEGESVFLTKEEKSILDAFRRIRKSSLRKSIHEVIAALSEQKRKSGEVENSI